MKRQSGSEAVRKAFILLGRATRFPNKFFLPVGDETLLEREVRILRSVGLEVAAVSVTPLDLPGLAVLHDQYDVGPLGALATILTATDEPAFLFGGDMPFLDPNAIEVMRSRFDGRTMVPIGPEGRWEVLHSIYADTDPSMVATHLRSNGGLRGLVEELRQSGAVQFIAPGVIDFRSFTDIDTANDYARVEQLLGSGPP